MAKTTKARPAKQPVRASSLGDDGEIDADVAEARKRAGIALRKMTASSTMIYAGSGLRASERAKMKAAKKPAVKKTVVKKTAKKAVAKKAATRKPPTKRPAAKATKAPEAGQSKRGAVGKTATKRRRTRTPVQLIRRLVDTIDRQLDQIDTIMRDPRRGDSGAGEAERHARTVAALARVTVELRKELEAGRRRRADDDSAAGRDQSVDPDRPRDLDELRERLSRRLDIRLESGSAVSVGDDAADGNRLSE